MKKIIYSIMFFSCIIFSCNCNNRHNKTIVQTEDKITEPKDSLKIKADQLREAYEKNNYFGFFKLFPSTFDEFQKLYGFDDEKGRMPLYQYYDKHIDFFFDSYELNKEYFIPKIFKIAKDGHWEADAVSFFQNELINFITYKTKEVVGYLDSKPDKELKSFWRFLFDGPHPNDPGVKKRYNDLYHIISQKNYRVAELMKHAYNKLLEEEHCPGH